MCFKGFPPAADEDKRNVIVVDFTDEFDHGPPRTPSGDSGSTICWAGKITLSRGKRAAVRASMHNSTLTAGGLARRMQMVGRRYGTGLPAS